MSLNKIQERLTRILGDAYVRPLGKYNYARAIIFTNELASSALSATKESVEEAGVAQRETDQSTGAPLVKLKYSDETIPVWRDRTAYNIDDNDLDVAAESGDFSRITKKVNACFTVFHRTMHDNIMIGRGTYKGLTNVALKAGNILTPVTTTLEDMTAVQAHKLITEMFGLTFSLSNQDQVANTVLMSTTAFTALAQKVYDAQPGISLLEALQNAGRALQLENGGDETTPFRIIPTHSMVNKMRCYDRSTRLMQAEIPMPLEFQDPYRDASGEVFIGRFKYTPIQFNSLSGMVEVSGIG